MKIKSSIVIISSGLISFILNLTNFNFARAEFITPSGPANLGTAITGELGKTGAAGYGSAQATSPTIIVGNIIYGILTVVGIIFTVLTLYAGFLWMTAAGNEETIKKAKKLISNSIIGLIIVLAAYSISFFVISKIISAANTS